MKILLLLLAFSALVMQLVPFGSARAEPAYQFELSDNSESLVLGTPESPPATSVGHEWVTVKVFTNDTRVHTMIYKWISPYGRTVYAEEQTSTDNTIYMDKWFSSYYRPGNIGSWKVQVLLIGDYHPEIDTTSKAGQYPNNATDVIRIGEIPFEVSGFVVPEFPFGTIIGVISSAGAFGIYYFKYRQLNMVDIKPAPSDL